MKRFSISLFAVLLAIGFAAFTKPKTTAHNKLDSHFYRYTESVNTFMTDPEKYVYSADDEGCGADNNIVCIILAPGTDGTGDHPSFTLGTNPYSNEVGVSVEVEKSSSR